MSKQQRVRLIETHGEECTDDWHGVVQEDTVRTCCGHALDATGDFDWDDKFVIRGGITCQDCLEQIAQYKEIRL